MRQTSTCITLVSSALLALFFTSCGDDEDGKNTTTPSELVSSWTATASGDVSAMFSGDAVLATTSSPDKLTIVLTPDAETYTGSMEDTRILLDLKSAGSGQTGDFTGVTEASVSVRIAEDGEGDCGTSTHTITLDSNGAGGVKGTFNLSVLCTGSEGTSSYQLSGTFDRNLPPD